MLHAKCAGREGYARIVRNNYEDAQWFANRLLSHDAFELLYNPDLNIVLYRYLPLKFRTKSSFTSEELKEVNDFNRTLQKTQFERGNSFVSYTEIKRKGEEEYSVMFRTVFMNPFTSEYDLELMLDEQEKIGAELENRAFVSKLSVSSDFVCIGRPIGNVQIYILDDQLNVLPKNVIGEICVSGDCLSLGYTQNDTSGRFIEHPFAEGKRLFRTGDIGKWSADGSIELIGRKDHQVKIRGNRIELGDVEACLSRHPHIDYAIATVSERNGDNVLAVFYTLSSATKVDEVRSYLGELLPDYMVPDHLL